MKGALQKLGVEKISEKHGKVTFIFYGSNHLEAKTIANVMRKYPANAFVNAGRKPFIRYDIKDKRHKMEDLLEFVKTMVG